MESLFQWCITVGPLAILMLLFAFGGSTTTAVKRMNPNVRQQVEEHNEICTIILGIGFLVFIIIGIAYSCTK